MGHMTRDFIDKAREVKPIAMISEGTRVAPTEKRKEFSEQEVWDYVAARLTEHPDKLVITTFYGRDIDRIKTYHSLAQQYNRKFVVSWKVAHLLHALQGDPRIQVPDPFVDPNILMYGREKTRYYRWESPYIDHSIDAQYVHDHQAEIILHLDFTQFGELIDIQPDPGTLFINSLSEPFQEEDIEDQVKDNWLDHFQIERHQAHASGHAPMAEIFDIVNEINPGVVMPVHTEHPEMFKDGVVVPVTLPNKLGTVSF
jgi:ribonuclease J